MFPISFQRVLAVACLACGPWAVHAASLVFSPSTQQVDRGQVASVDVTVTGLSNQRVGAYDFFVEFDATRLSWINADFGAALGQSSGDSFTDVDAEPGRVNLSEGSLLFDLSGLQSGSGDLLLFTLRFLTTATGTADLSFAANIAGAASGFLGDHNGFLLPITTPDPGSITIVTAAPPPPPPASGPVVTPPNPVPEPSSLALLLAAVAAAAAATVGRRAGPQRG